MPDRNPTPLSLLLLFLRKLLLTLIFQFTKADLSLSVYPVLAALASYNRYSFNDFQCCGSGMFLPDPGSEFFPSQIPDTHQRIEVF